MLNEIINVELLQTKTMGELRHLMTETGLGWSNKDKKVELIQRYAEFAMTAQPSDRSVPEPEPVRKKVVVKPAERSELEEALADLISRGMRLSTDNTTWNVKFGVREDSGNLALPINVIRRCAERIVNAA